MQSVTQDIYYSEIESPGNKNIPERGFRSESVIELQHLILRDSKFDRPATEIFLVKNKKTCCRSIHTTESMN